MPPVLSSVGKRKAAGVGVTRYDPTGVNHTPANPAPWTFDPPKLARKMARLKRRLKFVGAIQKLRKRLGFHAWCQANRELASRLTPSTSCSISPGLPMFSCHGPNSGGCRLYECGWQISAVCSKQQCEHRSMSGCPFSWPQLLHFKLQCQSCTLESPWLLKGEAAGFWGHSKWELAQQRFWETYQKSLLGFVRQG